jgi:hypothetical protein
MATFYLLPARPQLGKQFGELLTELFPGLTWPRSSWHDLAESLAAAAQDNGDRYVVFAEDLPADLPIEEALALYFGAEAGDEIISVRPGLRLADIDTRRWTFGAAARAA